MAAGVRRSFGLPSGARLSIASQLRLYGVYTRYGLPSWVSTSSGACMQASA